MNWIDVCERLPESDDWILLAACGGRSIEMGIYMDGRFVDPDFGYIPFYDVTHWMSLPHMPVQK